MLDLLTASPSVGSLRLEPMTTAEIDAHPDCDRIWATIAAARQAAYSQVEEDQPDERAISEDAATDQRSEDISAISAWARRVKRDFDAAHPDQSETPAAVWFKEKISQADLVL